MDNIDLYLMYIRKSRVDREAEEGGIGDTLERHRNALLALAKKRNYFISKIYEEVVSGDSIAERPEVQKLLRAVETGKYAGVLVMEVERLARGKTSDQGIVADTFQLSGTKIITPNKIYDPLNEADEEYFEFGLFMSRREYKTINRRLQRGKRASLEEGKYIAGAAPYGYEKVKLQKQKGYSLKILPEQAEIVRRIFDLYVNGEMQPDGTFRQYGSFTIAKMLDAQGIPSPAGGLWPACTVKDIIINPTYCGKIRWSYRPTIKRVIDGEVIYSRPVQKNVEYVDGIHEPIIDKETWEKAQKILSCRSKTPLPKNKEMRNPLSGLVFCSKCGRSMERRKFQHGKTMLLCPSKSCETKASVLEEVELSLMDGLREWLKQYKMSQAQRLELEKKPDKSKEMERSLSRISVTLNTLNRQRESLFDLLEQGIYTKEVFLERSNAIAKKIDEATQQYKVTEKRLEAERKISGQQSNIIPKIERVLDLYEKLESAKEKNDLLKEAIEQITYSKSVGGRWEESDMQLSILPKIR